MIALAATCGFDDTRTRELELRVRSHAWVAGAQVVVPPAAAGVVPSRRMLVVPSARGIQALRTHGKPSMVEEFSSLGPSAEGVEWRLVEDLDACRSDDEIYRSWPILSGASVEHGAKLTCGVRIPYEMRIFEGHFPAMPIVPGVVQLGWVIELAAEHLGSPRRVTGISSAKFRRLVQPGMALRLCVEWNTALREIRFEYTQADRCVAVGRLAPGARDV